MSVIFKRAMSTLTESPLLVSLMDGAVAVARPKQLNALNEELITRLMATLKELDQDESIRAVVIAGDEKAFAAGADIKAMANLQSTDEAIARDALGQFGLIKTFRKPLIASVKGLALGGGCELAMMCDIIIASSSAQFGQPELNLGTIPGMGGTQRLTRTVGKSKAMEYILSCRRISAVEAEKSGLISRVVYPPTDVDAVAVELAREIARFPATTVQMAKECINRSLETSLEEGLLFEKRMFHSTFSSAARREGMTAFIEKRAPRFNVGSKL